MNLAHLSLHRRTNKGDLRNVPWYFAGEKAQGDEYLSPTGAVVDVGRKYAIEFTEQGRQVLVLTGDGFGQHMQFTAERLIHAAKQGWYGMTLLWDMTDEQPEPTPPVATVEPRESPE